jgi:plastocyanin
VPADTAFQIHFVNNDAGIPHNVAVHDQGNAEIFKGEIFPGVAERTYDVPALAAGEYTFICTVHPNMAGTLTAE